MERIRVVVALAAVLSLGSLLKAEDTVVLNDGSVLSGEVVQDTAAQVVVMDHGVQRTLQRSLVAKVEFNTGPSQPRTVPAGGAAAQGGDFSSDAGDTVPIAPAGEAPPPAHGAMAPPGDGGSSPSDGMAQGGGVPPAGPQDGVVPIAPTLDQQEYALGVANYYQVPRDMVWGFEQQGIPYEELPVVFYVAGRARCAPGLVVSLRLGGMSWASICGHFGLGPGIFYWRNLFRADLGGPYAPIYFGFKHFPHPRWNWNLIALNDAEVVNCVNLRFQTAYWHCPPREVVRWRREGHPFFWAGYGHRDFHGKRPGRWKSARGRFGNGKRKGRRETPQGGGMDGGSVDQNQWNHN